jgi:hypothetical protein
MSDNKFERQNDRQIILSDMKARIIDLMQNNQDLPSVGIYDEPVRYFKANEQWCAIIFGWLDWLEDVAGWRDAENELYQGIQAILTFEEGIQPPTLPSEGDCLNYLPSASFFDFYPQNPYNQPNYTPPDYLVPPFFVNSDFEFPEALGYQATDIMLNSAAFTIDPIDIATLNFPRMVISVQGSGEIEIDFLAVQNGGYVVVKIGSMPNIGDIIVEQVVDTGVRIIDLNNDKLSIPPEANVVQNSEFNIVAEPDAITEIYCVFVPRLDDSLIPLNFGGGIRAIQLCGFGQDAGGTELEDFRFNTETCTFEKRVAGVWEVIEGGDEWLACVGGGMATKQDIKEALIEWTKDTALKIVSGATGGIVIDEDGNVTIGGEDGDAGLPEDDPTTEVDETAVARSGGATAVRIGINSIWSNLDSWYDFSVSEANAVERLTLLYELNPAETAEFVAYYYAQRAASQQYVSSFASTLDGYLYCKGNNKQVIAEWVFEVGAIATIAMSSLMVEALTQGQLDNWFTQGTQVPSTDYVAFSCVPIDPEQWTLDAAYLQTSAYKTGASIGKTNHRILIEVSGKVNHPSDGSYQDFFYHVASNGTKSFVGIATSFGSLQFNDNLSNPPQSKVPWKASGVYAVTMETTSAQAYRFRRVISAANQAAGTTGFTIKLTDLGEVIN